MLSHYDMRMGVYDLHSYKLNDSYGRSQGHYPSMIQEYERETYGFRNCPAKFYRDGVLFHLRLFGNSAVNATPGIGGRH